MTDVFLFRTVSPFLKCFGWKTNDITESTDLSTDISAAFKKLTEALVQFDTVEFKIAIDLQDYIRTYFMSENSMDLLLQSSLSAIASKQRGQIIAIIFSYKLYDIQRWISIGDVDAMFLKGTGGSIEEDRYQKMWTHRISDWVEVIHKAEHNLKQVLMKDTLSDRGEGSHSTTLLANQLCEHITKVDGQKILTNVIAFALHVSFIISTGRQDLPNTTDIINELELTGELEARTKALFLSLNDAQLKNPLYLALGVSPLLLLIPIQWIKKKISPVLILHWWQTFSGHEPSSLRRIEYALWQVLFDIVLNPRGIIVKLLGFVSSISKEGISSEDTRWFSEENIQNFLKNKFASSASGSNQSDATHANPANTNATARTNTVNNTPDAPDAPAAPTSLPPKTTNNTSTPDAPDAPAPPTSLAPKTTNNASTPDAPDAPAAPTSLPPNTTNTNVNANAPTTPDTPSSPLTPTTPKSPNLTTKKTVNKNPSIDRNTNLSTVATRLRQLRSQVEPTSPAPTAPAGNDSGYRSDGNSSNGGQSPTSHHNEKKRGKGATTRRHIDFASSRQEGPSSKAKTNKTGMHKQAVGATGDENDAHMSQNEILSQIAIVGGLGTNAVGEFHERHLHTAGRRETNFDSSIQVPRPFGGKPITVYDVHHNAVKWVPNFHGSTEYKFLLELLDACKNDGVLKPYAIANSNGLLQDTESTFITCTKEDFTKMSADTMQNLFKTRHIIVTNTKAMEPNRVQWSFEREFLKKLDDWDKPITMQDQSVQCTDDFSQVVVFGTLKDLHHCASTKDAKILNALDFHPGTAIDPPLQIASDVEAYRRTQDMPFCIKPYPRRPMRWGLAATKDARHFWHIDSDGFASYFVPKCGQKIIFIAKSSSGRKYDTFASSDLFSNFDVAEVDSDLLDVEYVVLDDDTEFYMRPNSLHAVYTIRASICLGGHFIAQSTIQDTCFGIYQTFITASSITNATLFAASRDIFIRMAILFERVIVEERDKDPADVDDDEQSHVIDPSTINGAMDLFTFSNLIEIMSILDATLGETEMPLLDREALIYARRSVRMTLTVFFNKYAIEENGQEIDDPEGNVYLRYLARHITTLHAALEKRTASSDPSPLPEMFRNDVEIAFGNYDKFWHFWEQEGTWDSTNSTVPSSFLWQDAQQWSVVERTPETIPGMINILHQNQIETEFLSEEEIEAWWDSINGLDGFDLQYYDTLQLNFRTVMNGRGVGRASIFPTSK